MRPEWSWLILSSVLWWTTTANPDIYVAMPNALRLDADESVAIFLDRTTRHEFNIFVMDHPGKTKNITYTRERVTPQVPMIVTIRVQGEDLPPTMLLDPNERSFVVVIVKSDNFHKEVVLPLSTKSGYVYLQTDKPIYTPKEKVNFRVIRLNEEGMPSDMKFRFQIRNPRNTIVRDTETKTTEKLFVIPTEFTFSSFPLLGLWSASVLYGHNYQRNTTVHFELQKYVLPTFTVTVTAPEVILPTTTVISISAEAKYVYGKHVNGMVSFTLGVQGEAPKGVIFLVLNPAYLDDGSLHHLVNISVLKQRNDIGWFPEIEGSRLIVNATVVDEASGVTETGTNDTARFTRSPYKISFKRCRNDFKPGLSSLVQIDVTYADGRPAPSVKTNISAIADARTPLIISRNTAISNKEGRIVFEIQAEMHHQSIEIIVRTAENKYGQNQAEGRFIQKKYISQTNAYLSITNNMKGVIQPGDIFSESIEFEPANISDVFCLVVSRGKIYQASKFPRGSVKNRKFEFPVTYDMVPSFRIVAFATYMNELIADSRRVQVAEECRPEAVVKIDPEFPVEEPGRIGKIHITGSKSTSVGFLAIDSAVYALSKQETITKSKMFKTMDSHDLGCGPGGGLRTETVLSHAGVVIMSNIHSPPDQTAVSACEEKVRKKREAIASKLNEYKGKLRYCCALGMNIDKYERTCMQRAAVVKKHLHANDKNCSVVFLECCTNHQQEGMVLAKSNLLARMGGSDISEANFVFENDEEFTDDNTNIRQNFLERWIFVEKLIGLDGKEFLNLTLPHSITTWVIQALSLSKEHGMCVTEPKTVKAFKKIFVQLNLPYSVVRNEQVEITATVFNYDTHNHKVVVYMYGQKDVCSGAQEGERSERKRIEVEANSGVTVGFPLIPLRHGEFPIKVVAQFYDGRDIVMKMLNVVPEGAEEEKNFVVLLDPSNQRKRSKRDTTTSIPDFNDRIEESQKLQVTAIKLRAPEDFIHGTESCVITAIGDQFGPTVDTALSNPESLLQAPNGCGEQNMIRFAPTIYTMRYLKATGQINQEREAMGFDLVRQGYAHQLKYRNEDGGFSVWAGQTSSTWLTAFTIRVFCHASHLIHVDEEIMCSGLKMLASRQDNDGSFIEQNLGYHTEMMGGGQGKVPLTAYILLTFYECTCNIPNSQIVKARALSYLEENFDNVKDPLALAIVTYALALGDSEMKRTAKDKLMTMSTTDQDQLHWGKDNNAKSIETTSYALLVQLHFNDMEKSNAIVNWLNTKSLPSGAYHSTQDTIVALHAMSDYAIRARTPGIDLVSDITYSDDKSFMKTMTFNEMNALVLQHEQINRLGGSLLIKTRGHGIGKLGVKVRYNVPLQPSAICQFEIKLNITEVKETAVDTIVGTDGKDTYIHQSDLIRTLPLALEAAPETVEYDVDPRNRQSRGVRMQSLRVDRAGSLVDRSRSARVKRNDDDGNSKPMLKIQICVRYLGSHDAEMTIVDVGIFSGYEPIIIDLETLESDADHLIQKYETSSRGVVFYLRKGPAQEAYCFDFRVRREYRVGKIHSSVIKVYDYYNPDKKCTRFYSPDNNSPKIRHICNAGRRGICQCAEGGCPSKDPFSFFNRSNENKLKIVACEEHNYVWKGRAKELPVKKDGWLYTNFTIEKVFKAGIEKAVLIVNEVRLLVSRDNCETAELYPNEVYILMGKDGDKYENDQGKLWYRYFVDQNTKVYKWTNARRGKKNFNLEKALTRLAKDLTDVGCAD